MAERTLPSSPPLEAYSPCAGPQFAISWLGTGAREEDTLLARGTHGKAWELTGGKGRSPDDPSGSGAPDALQFPREFSGRRQERNRGFPEPGWSPWSPGNRALENASALRVGGRCCPVHLAAFGVVPTREEAQKRLRNLAAAKPGLSSERSPRRPPV